jgi:hypothetical protein
MTERTGGSDLSQSETIAREQVAHIKQHTHKTPFLRIIFRKMVPIGCTATNSLQVPRQAKWLLDLHAQWTNRETQSQEPKAYRVSSYAWIATPRRVLSMA